MQTEETKKKTIDYYRNCLDDYIFFWDLNKYLAIHVGYYDEKHKNHGSAVLNMNRKMADMAGIKKGGRVLDAGCGVGGSSVWLAKNLGARAVGVNIDNNQIKLARKNAEKAGVSDLTEFIEADYTDTRLPEKSFDVVWGLEAICYADNKHDFIKEAERVLKPGGKIIVADGFMSRRNITEKEKEEMGQWLGGVAVPNLAGRDEFERHLKESGFKNISYKDISKNVLPSSNKLYYWVGLTLYPFVKILRATGADRFFGRKLCSRMGDVIFSYFNPRTLKKGLWEYGIFYAEKPF